MDSFFRPWARPALVVAALALPLFGPLAASADDEGAHGVGVARLSVIAGNVAIGRGDSQKPVAAAINAPVLGADYVRTGDEARAEIQFDGSTFARLGENVQVRFTRIDTDVREMQLAQGTMELRLLRGTDGTSTIDTPSISVRPRESGRYRITVTNDGQTRVTVRSGRADIITPEGNQSIAPGSTIVATGEASNPVVASSDPVALDRFDRFNADRDRIVERALTQTYVNPNIDGVADLGEYGRWVDDPSYGNLWVPTNVATDWAPYRTGRWVWEGGYGWTWVADEPWGWAPYHYGSWYHSPAYGWAWFPPPVNDIPIWRPACVAFFSFGGGQDGLGFGFGQNIGWVPLAPYERYHPWYGDWQGNTVPINQTVNITNNYYVNNVTNTNVTHTYRNTQFGGVTSVTGQRFTEGRFDHPTVVSATQLRRVQIAHGALPIVPTANNLRFNNRAVPNNVAMHPALDVRSFAGDPTIATRASFNEQRSALATAAHLAAATHEDTLTTRTVVPRLTAPTSIQREASPWDRFGSRVPTTATRPQADSGSRYTTSRAVPPRSEVPRTESPRTYQAPVRTMPYAPPPARAVEQRVVPQRTYATPPRPATPQSAPRHEAPAPAPHSRETH